MPRNPNILTATQAKGMVEDIVGATMKQVLEKIEDDKRSADPIRTELSYFRRHSRDVKSGMAALKPEEKLEKMAIFLGCLGVAGAKNLEGAAKLAKEFGDELVAKSLASSSIGAGGAMVVPEFAAEIIPFLRAQTIVAQLGARVIPMESGILQFGRVGSGAVAAYRGEGAAASYSQATTEELNLRARILSVMVAATKQLLSRTRGAGAQFIQEDLVAAANDKQDSTFIRSDGSVDKPRGLLHLAVAANKSNETNVAGTAGGSTLAEINKDLGGMVQKLMDGNIPFLSPGWGFAPRTWMKLYTLLDGNGNAPFRAMLESGKLFGFPWKQTTNIPTNLTAAGGSGGGANASELYLAAFGNLIIGETQGMEISQSSEAAYDDGTGMKSAFQRGEQLFQIDLEHDFVDRFGGKSIVVKESLTWGV